jgi:hypothetical protein
VREASRTGFLKGNWAYNPKDSVIMYRGKTTRDSFSVVLTKYTGDFLVFKNRSQTPTFYFLSRKKITRRKGPNLSGKWFFSKIISLPEAIENEDFKREFEAKIKKKSFIHLLKDGSGTTFYAEKTKSIQWMLSADNKFLIFWETGKKVPTVYRVKRKTQNLQLELFDGYWFELKK